MNKKEFIKAVTDTLRVNNMRKPIYVPKQVFHISDDEGNQSTFSVKQTQKTAIYTLVDVEAFLDACISVIEDALEHGDSVVIHDFGVLQLKYWKPRELNRIGTDEKMAMKGHYIPKFVAGKGLRRCAKLYESFKEAKEEENNLNFEIESSD